MAALATVSGSTMGTRWTVRAAIGAGAEGELTRQLQAAVDRVDAQMSNWKPDSALSRFNAAPVGEWFEIEPEFAAVVALGIEMGALTGGAFDMTLGRLVGLWGFGPGG
ncbi:MAG: FAD:protein FMN transferase [Devosia sp.]